jgi:hypothetical protein
MQESHVWFCEMRDGIWCSDGCPTYGCIGRRWGLLQEQTEMKTGAEQTTQSHSVADHKSDASRTDKRCCVYVQSIFFSLVSPWHPSQYPRTHDSCFGLTRRSRLSSFASLDLQGGLLYASNLVGYTSAVEIGFGDSYFSILFFLVVDNLLRLALFYCACTADSDQTVSERKGATR